MKATNLLLNKTYNVNQYENVLYIDFGNGNYYILELCNYKEDSIEEGKEHTHYKIEDKLYNGFYTNDFTAFANKQISLWELI